MREAEKEERLVLLQNLDPTFTSDEVQVLAYLLNQCNLMKLYYGKSHLFAGLPLVSLLIYYLIIFLSGYSLFCFE